MSVFRRAPYLCCPILSWSSEKSKKATHTRGGGLTQLRGEDLEKKNQAASEREELAEEWRRQMEEKKRQKEEEAAR